MTIYKITEPNKREKQKMPRIEHPAKYSDAWTAPCGHENRSKTMDRENYNAMVDKYLSDDSSIVFNNFSPEHASHIITRFLESAQNSVEVLSGNFADDFYDNLALTFLLQQTSMRLKNNDGKIRVITTSGKRNKTLTGLANNGIIEYIPALYKHESDGSDINHFLVVDAKRYRLEAVHEKSEKTPECVHAEVCCNGRKKASGLVNYFNLVWTALRPKEKLVAEDDEDDGIDDN